jgi:hypothetical protein
MIRLGTRTNGELRRRTIPVLDDSYFKAEWMESGADSALSPTVALIEQPPNSVLVPHFHRQNQFQLFVDGSGSIGASPLSPLSIHYAGAYTGYGPLVAGPEGIKYFTMRSVCETGLVPISEAREKMLRGPKRHAQCGPIHVASDVDLGALTEIQTAVVIPLADDGLGAEVIHVPGSGTLLPQRLAASAGFFLVVLAGALNSADAQLGFLESLFVSADEIMPAFAAGKVGLQVLVLHLPRKESVYP